ncbi:FecR family protein [Sphingobacterium pedocola]|uniref:Anti-sigma factor n=1 Tax=Sphingobacterium pedocola TaxID=2082722 RepID=A0ABR9T6S5_9SPHI|nr:FecR family protein [Sphingobacterium pedocola]MBE8720769.1 anti-sigma factor [Sphingobacterium pedocola]
MLTEGEYIILYEKCNSGNCTPTELQQLEAYHDTFEFSDRSWDETRMGRKDEVKTRLQKLLNEELRQDICASPNLFFSRQRIYSIIKYSAVAVFLMCFGIYWVSESHIFIDKKSNVNDHRVIAPGGNKAVLVLEDGTEVNLNDLIIGDFSIDGEAVAHKDTPGQLRYNSLSHSSEKISYHTIRTPPGGQYHIELADGTKVWLNAASSIRFPARFSGVKRTVEIEGEVYFDVAKQSENPFVVKSSGQEITVLGTRFNVAAYPDEEEVQTSLIEGSVVLNVVNQQYSLTPGECTIYDKRHNSVDKATFNPDAVLAWQNGNFVFNMEDIQSVMRKISRWYDVEVIYKGDMKEKLFSGTISRFGQVEEVLDMLALTETVTFKIEGRRIYVME